MSAGAFETDDGIDVEVCYATATRQWVVPLRVRRGATVAEAIAASKLGERIAGLSIDPERVGVHSERVALDAPLRGGERIEIYRPLAVDPMTQRRARAKDFKRRRY